MKITIIRSYYPQGTNGLLYINDAVHPLCRTIELPWKNNERSISCIPEGKYRIQFRNSEQFGDHLILPHVVNRSLILIHPANDALTELRGCIAPVTQFIGEGKGSRSVMAFNKLMKVVNAALITGPVYLIIKKQRL